MQEVYLLRLSTEILTQICKIIQPCIINLPNKVVKYVPNIHRFWLACFFNKKAQFKLGRALIGAEISNYVKKNPYSKCTCGIDSFISQVSINVGSNHHITLSYEYTKYIEYLAVKQKDSMIIKQISIQGFMAAYDFGCLSNILEKFYTVTNLTVNIRFTLKQIGENFPNLIELNCQNLDNGLCAKDLVLKNLLHLKLSNFFDADLEHIPNLVSLSFERTSRAKFILSHEYLKFFSCKSYCGFSLHIVSDLDCLEVLHLHGPIKLLFGVNRKIADKSVSTLLDDNRKIADKSVTTLLDVNREIANKSVTTLLDVNRKIADENSSGFLDVGVQCPVLRELMLTNDNIDISHLKRFSLSLLTLKIIGAISSTSNLLDLAIFKNLQHLQLKSNIFPPVLPPKLEKLTLMLNNDWDKVKIMSELKKSNFDPEKFEYFVAN
jgi:hypothetical protein